MTKETTMQYIAIKDIPNTDHKENYIFYGYEDDFVVIKSKAVTYEVLEVLGFIKRVKESNMISHTKISKDLNLQIVKSFEDIEDEYCRLGQSSVSATLKISIEVNNNTIYTLEEGDLLIDSNGEISVYTEYDDYFELHNIFTIQNTND